MDIKYKVDPNIKTVHSTDQILSIVSDYKDRYNLSSILEFIELEPLFRINESIIWIVGEYYILCDEKRRFDYIVPDKTGIVEYISTETGEYKPHLKKEKTPEEIAEDEAFLQELRDEGFDIIE